MTPIMTQPPLAAFTSALKKGSGRAMTLFRADPGNQAFGVALMHACRVNLVYDKQCEEDRCHYLYRLIRSTGQVEYYRTELLNGLVASQAVDPLGKIQIFGILCLMAADDGSFDRSILCDFLCRTDYDTIGCIYGFVRLEGIDGLLLCVQHFSPALIGNLDDGGWIFQSLVDELAEGDGADAAQAALQNARSTSAELNVLMSRADTAAAPPRQDTAGALDYGTVKAQLDPRHGFPRDWIAEASAADLLAAADDLMVAHDEQNILHYLLVFWRREFPRPPQDLFHFLGSANPRIVLSAARVSKRLNHPDVRALALQLMSEGRQPEIAIRLRRSSFQPGDLKIATALVETLDPDEDGWHGIGLAVLDVLRNADVPAQESQRILLLLYEQVPCSLCRGSVVDKLAAASGVPDWMAEECQFDVDPRTADLGRQITQRS